MLLERGHIVFELLSVFDREVFLRVFQLNDNDLKFLVGLTGIRSLAYSLPRCGDVGTAAPRYLPQFLGLLNCRFQLLVCCQDGAVRLDDPRKLFDELLQIGFCAMVDIVVQRGMGSDAGQTRVRRRSDAQSLESRFQPPAGSKRSCPSRRLADPGKVCRGDCLSSWDGAANVEKNWVTWRPIHHARGSLCCQARGDSTPLPCLRRSAPPPQASSREMLQMGRAPEVGMAR